MQIKRRKTRVVKIGNIAIGGKNPVAIQSMAKTKTADLEKTSRQIRGLAAAGCEIVRVAVKDEADALAIRYLKKDVKIPVVADIHFDWRLALLAIESGADKIRLNPGNIYREDEVKKIARAARLHHIPIRVGLNSGSLGTPRTKGNDTAAAMVKEALGYLKILEKTGLYNIVISLKGSDILDTIAAYRRMSRYCNYPFHLGVTATGLPQEGAIKSSIAIGTLLLEGIGDTIRVSLTDQPEEEIRVGRCILQALGIRNFGYEVVSCPTCGRCEVALIPKVRELQERLLGRHFKSSCRRRPFKIALMGCVVNGPGEAREADIGVAFGKREGLLFKKGRSVRKVSFADCLDVLLSEVKR